MVYIDEGLWSGCKDCLWIFGGYGLYTVLTDSFFSDCMCGAFLENEIQN